MRLIIKKGKQRKLINLAKQRFTWSELSNKINISEGYLRNDLRKEKKLLSKEIYTKLCGLTNKNFDKFVIKEINENWGQIKGGKNSRGNTKKIRIPDESEELAEFYGIMLGDGNSHRTKFYKSRNNKRGTYAIRIVGDSRYDKEYLINYVKPLIEDLFNIKVRSGKFKPKNNFKNSKNGMFLSANGIELINFLEKKGFKPGNKIKNKLSIPNWIKNNPLFLKSCLRGLYDTDGSVYKLKNQNCFQFCFTNYNPILLNDSRIALLKLEINCSKISKGKEVRITKKSELRKFLKLVGFSNNRHLKKIKMWNLNSPVV